jgi:hypothetical protein
MWEFVSIGGPRVALAEGNLEPSDILATSSLVPAADIAEDHWWPTGAQKGPSNLESLFTYGK